MQDLGHDTFLNSAMLLLVQLLVTQNNGSSIYVCSHKNHFIYRNQNTNNSKHYSWTVLKCGMFNPQSTVMAFVLHSLCTVYLIHEKFCLVMWIWLISTEVSLVCMKGFFVKNTGQKNHSDLTNIMYRDISNFCTVCIAYYQKCITISQSRC